LFGTLRITDQSCLHCRLIARKGKTTMMEPTIALSEMKRCDLLKLSGRFDSFQAPRLEAQFTELMNRGRYHFVVDLSDLDFASSGMLRVLLGTRRQLRRWNRGDVYLAAVPERIVSVFDLAGILPLFKVYDTTAAAIGDW
jgi:anti-sigma B factor antagonist